MQIHTPTAFYAMINKNIIFTCYDALHKFKFASNKELQISASIIIITEIHICLSKTGLLKDR